MKGYINLTPFGADIKVTAWCEGFDGRCTIPATNRKLIKAIVLDNEKILLDHMHCKEVETDDQRLDD